MADFRKRGLGLGCLLLAPFLGGADGGCSNGQVVIGGEAGESGSAGGPGQAGAPSNAGRGGEPAVAGQPSQGGAAGAPTFGGRAGSGAAAAECEGERSAMTEFLDANRACESSADCQMNQVGCGVTDDGCTGTVYVNEDTDLVALTTLRDAFTSCVEPSGCVPACERLSPPPACVAGRCGLPSNCEDETQAVLDFIEENKSCATTDDCRDLGVGCGITEDGCTGAVYVNEATDTAAFEGVTRAFFSCLGTNGCSACFRAISPPACVSGRCVNGLE